MIAADVMSRNVIVVRRDASVAQAAQTMIQHRISGLPVVDEEGKIVGLLTEGDLLRRIETDTDRHPGWLASFISPGGTARTYTIEHARRVSEIMATDVISVSPDTPLGEVVSIMETHGVKRVPVLEEERLVGILTRADLVKALLKLLPRQADVPAIADEEIRKRLLEEIARQRWAPTVGIEVAVKEGMIELKGFVSDDRVRSALRVIAENTHGARGVRDRLMCIEPLSGTILSGPQEPQRY